MYEVVQKKATEVQKGHCRFATSRTRSAAQVEEKSQRVILARRSVFEPLEAKKEWSALKVSSTFY